VNAPQRTVIVVASDLAIAVLVAARRHFYLGWHRTADLPTGPSTDDNQN